MAANRAAADEIRSCATSVGKALRPTARTARSTSIAAAVFDEVVIVTSTSWPAWRSAAASRSITLWRTRWPQDFGRYQAPMAWENRHRPRTDAMTVPGPSSRAAPSTSVPDFRVWTMWIFKASPFWVSARWQ